MCWAEDKMHVSLARRWYLMLDENIISECRPRAQMAECLDPRAFQYFGAER